jgi:hypothetical protein
MKGQHLGKIGLQEEIPVYHPQLIALDGGFDFPKRSSGAVSSFLDETFLWEWVVTEIVFKIFPISRVHTKYQSVDPDSAQDRSQILI